MAPPSRTCTCKWYSANWKRILNWTKAYFSQDTGTYKACLHKMETLHQYYKYLFHCSHLYLTLQIQMFVVSSPYDHDMYPFIRWTMLRITQDISESILSHLWQLCFQHSLNRIALIANGKHIVDSRCFSLIMVLYTYPLIWKRIWSTKILCNS